MATTAKQAQSKTAADTVPILGQGLVGGHPGESSLAGLDLKGRAAGSLLLWLLLLL